MASIFLFEAFRTLSCLSFLIADLIIGMMEHLLPYLVIYISKFLAFLTIFKANTLFQSFFLHKSH